MKLASLHRHTVIPLTIATNVFFCAPFGVVTLKTINRPVGEVRSSVLQDLGVMQAYIQQRWHQTEPPGSFFLRGRKPVVDFSLGAIIPPSEPEEGWPLGDGLQEGDIHYYKDAKGTRLIVFIGAYDAPYTVILTRISKHRAQCVHKDLTSLRTGPGVGLGDMKQRVLNNLGKPSQTAHYGNYEVLMYVGKSVARSSGTKEQHKFYEACGKSIILRNRRVVEIWMHIYSKAPAP